MTWTVALLIASQALGLVLALTSATSPSRRLLAVAFAVIVPVGGPLLAWLVCRARGGCLDLSGERRAEARRRPDATQVRRMGDLPPMLDRLMSHDSSERMSAMVALSSVGDAMAVSLLRWVVEHGTPEMALEAALTLEELDLRRAAQVVHTGEALAATPTYAAAIDAAEALACRIHSGLVDAASLPQVLEQAREAFQLAIAMTPSGADALEEQLARLELLGGASAQALARLPRFAERLDAKVDRLRDDIAFAARRFELLSAPVEFAPAAARTRKAQPSVA